MKSRVYIFKEKEKQFNTHAFQIQFKIYGDNNKMKGCEVESMIAEKLHASQETVHKWRYGKSTPTDIETVENLAKTLEIDDFTKLLKNADGGHDMAKLTDRQITAVKKIYDICIWFLTEFDHSDGFNNYWHRLSALGDENPEETITNIADEMHKKVELVLDQEYFDLRDTEIYNELCEFVCDDLNDIYEGKVSYAYRFEADPKGNPTTNEDYGNAMLKLNGIIEKYV